MPSTITNLQRLQGVGILADRTAKSPSLQFRKFNLIYGFNGSGKSTLARLFASLESGAPHPKLPPACSFEVAMSEDSAYGYPEKLGGLERRIVVFNSDFQERNFQWSLGRASPVFFIGSDQAEAAAQLRELEHKIFEETVFTSSAEESLKRADKNLATFKREAAKITAERLHLGNRKYEARQLTSDYEKWPREETHLLGDEKLKAAEDTRKLAEPMPTIGELDFDAQNVLKAFQFIVETCSQSLADVALEEAKRFPDMLLWLRQGHAFHESELLSECLFCGNQISEARWQILTNALDAQVDQFVERLNKTAERLRNISANHDGIEPSIPGNDALSPELRPSYNERREELRSSLRDTKICLTALSKLIAAKLERPAAPVDLSNFLEEEDVRLRVSRLADAIAGLNDVVAAHNKLVRDFLSHKERASEAIRKHYIAKCRAEFDDLLAECSRAQRDLAAAEAKLKESKSAADDLRQKIRTHGPAAGVINRLVASYLGHSELTIAPLDEGYEIRRHGSAIEGDLSP